MTDKERLEDIKERYMEHEHDFNLIKNDINWLIEQAERVEELEELTTQMKYDVALFEKRTNEWLELKEQNKRYKQALEEINKLGWDSESFGGGYNFEGEIHAQAIKIAYEALEGKE